MRAGGILDTEETFSEKIRALLHELSLLLSPCLISADSNIKLMSLAVQSLYVFPKNRRCRQPE